VEGECNSWRVRAAVTACCCGCGCGCGYGKLVVAIPQGQEAARCRTRLAHRDVPLTV
jgi:hypothetical protein